MKNSKSIKYKLSFSARLYDICQRYPGLRNLKVLLYFLDKTMSLFLPKPKKEIFREKKEVFIMFNYAFGDAIVWLSVFKNLREIYDQDKYYITLMCKKGLFEIFENSKVFDKIIEYDLVGATYNLKKRFNLYKFLREKYYDIVLDPIGITECTSNIFMSMIIEADEKFSIIDLTDGNPLCPKWLYKKAYSNIFQIKEKNLSLIEYYSEFIRELGLTSFGVNFGNQRVNNNKLKLPSNYFIVFPSAGNYLKRWPLDRYANITKKIYEKLNVPLLMCGTNVDREAYDNMLKSLKEVPYVDVLGKTSLVEFIDLIKGAKLVVTNDTSTYHIAVVNQVPVAIITGGYTYDRYVKYDFKGSEKYKKPCIIVNKRDCFNCDNRCKYLKPGDKIWPCLDDITIDYAWEKIEKYIKERNI